MALTGVNATIEPLEFCGLQADVTMAAPFSEASEIIRALVGHLFPGACAGWDQKRYT